jgi:hypothetical protein
MKIARVRAVLVVVLMIQSMLTIGNAGASDALPSWNDGTLWAEQPKYFQAIFVFELIKGLAPRYPKWMSQEPYAAVLRRDVKAALAGGEPALMEMIMAAHTGMTTAEFDGRC